VTKPKLSVSLCVSCAASFPKRSMSIAQQLYQGADCVYAVRTRSSASFLCSAKTFIEVGSSPTVCVGDLNKLVNKNS
jgi:hypothetical protein